MSSESLVALKASVKGVILDINGVLYNNNSDGSFAAIEGSVEAVKRLKASGLPVRFCTNECTIHRDVMVAKLHQMGFDIEAADVFAPAPALRKVVEGRGLRPHFLVHTDVVREFEGMDCSDPNCVVIGDAQDHFTYQAVNEAFQVLMDLEHKVLIAMGAGKYYKHGDGLCLDVGPYVKAIEFACDTTAEVVGKPARAFFLTAVEDMGLQPAQTLMIGDDIVSDVGGAQAAGLMGVQVRTGKFRPSDEPHPTVIPQAYVDDLAQAVDSLLGGR